MSRPLLRMGITSVVALAVLLVTTLVGTTLPGSTATTIAAPANQQVVDAEYVTVAWNPYNDIPGSLPDCIVAASGVIQALRTKILVVAVSRAKMGDFLLSAAAAIPGVACGAGLGRKNVDVICWMSRRPSWVPGGQIARNFVYSASGGASRTCG